MRSILFFFIFFCSCSNTPESIKDFITLEKSAVETITEAEILHTENGILKVKINSNKIERFHDKEPQIVLTNGIEIFFYSDKAEIKSTLTADRAELDKKNKIMTASKNVVLTSVDNKKLETSVLFWDEKRNKIYTNSQVFVTTNKEQIIGDGFTSNTDFTNYSISNITGVINLQSDTE